MDVRYRHGPWQEMKEAIIRLKRDSERTLLQIDDLLGSIERKIDRLDSDRSISFHHTSKKIKINHLFDDYDQLVNYCHRVGETVSRHIDEPFYHKMDEFAGKMRDLSIRNYTTENRIGSTEYKAMPTAHSYGRLETSSVQKDTITIDDIFIEYETMEEEQQDLEMWRDLAIAAGIIVAAVVCPPVAIAATAVFTGLEVKSVVTGEDWGTGRKLSTGEQIERGAFSVLGVIPGVKGVRQAFRGTDDLISLTKQSIAQNLAKFNPNTGKNVVQSLKDSNTYWTQKLRLEGLKATDKLNDVNYAIKGAFARSLDNMNNLAAQSIDVTAGGAATLGRGGSNVEGVVKASHLESKGIIQSKIEKIEGSIKGTVKVPNSVPSVRNGEFNSWFNSLSVEEFDKVWADTKLRDSIKDRLRHPGGMHEWHLVSRADTFKYWGVTAEQIAEMRTLISETNFVNPPGKHGGRGSTKAHNELLKIIDTSVDYDMFKRRLQNWADYRFEGGSEGLPEGLKPKRR
ncbi:hypothetical protein [Priestia taiwanensis]|uniref:Toxin/Nuclease N-terminal domain-containing protein n=1 Tax=Priestia taiwanensis TaxID=1347902 RepID=A0A917ANB9_9BACI|nr:hypothetical protein [Priestia taiwanensis]GGE63231.1 hypothetical protein GCM10007140_11870 [Priestia taiwanensis]